MANHLHTVDKNYYYYYYYYHHLFCFVPPFNKEKTFQYTYRKEDFVNLSSS